jgi:hypothetical protein
MSGNNVGYRAIAQRAQRNRFGLQKFEATALIGLAPPEHSEGLVGHLGSLVPPGRVGRVEEAAVFLASDDSSFVKRNWAVCRWRHRSDLNPT